MKMVDVYVIDMLCAPPPPSGTLFQQTGGFVKLTPVRITVRRSGRDKESRNTPGFYL